MNGLLFKKRLRSAAPGDRRCGGNRATGPRALAEGAHGQRWPGLPTPDPRHKNRMQTGEATSVRRLSPRCPSAGARAGHTPFTCHRPAGRQNTAPREASLSHKPFKAIKVLFRPSQTHPDTNTQVGKMQMRTASPKRLSAPLSFEVTSSAVFKVLGGISWNVSGINSMRPKGNLSLLEEGQAAARTTLHRAPGWRGGRSPQRTGQAQAAESPVPGQLFHAEQTWLRGANSLLLVELSWSVTRLLAPRAF